MRLDTSKIVPMATAPTSTVTAPKSRKIFPPRFCGAVGWSVVSGVGLTGTFGLVSGLGEGIAVADGEGVGVGVGVAVGVGEGLGEGFTAAAPFTWTTA